MKAMARDNQTVKHDYGMGLFLVMMLFSFFLLKVWICVSNPFIKVNVGV